MKEAELQSLIMEYCKVPSNGLFAIRINCGLLKSGAGAFYRSIYTSNPDLKDKSLTDMLIGIKGTAKSFWAEAKTDELTMEVNNKGQLKTTRYRGKLSEGQKNFKDFCTWFGWPHYEIYTFDQFIQAVDEVRGLNG